MSELIVHVGTHKTATTHLQETLFAARDLLAAHGVIYPKLGHAAGHHGIVADTIALPVTYRLHGGGLAALEALADLWAGTDCRVILSSEEFSRIGPDGGAADIQAIGRIAARFGHVRVLALVRPQQQFLQAVHAEIARTRPAPNPHDMVESAVTAGRIDGLAVDYRLLYAHLRRGFAPEAIRLVDFGRARQTEGGILGLFLRLLRLPFGPDALGGNVARPLNPSPNALAVWAAQMLGAGGIVPAATLRLTSEAYRAVYGERPACLFTRPEVARLNQRFAGANAALAQGLATVQPGFHIATPLPDVDAVYREDIGAGFWLMVARLAARAA